MSSLDDLQDQVLTAQLYSLLDRIADHTAEVRERHAGEDDPAPVDLMEQACRAPGAPGELRALADRVDRGVVTWQQVWSTPSAHDGGHRLVREVLRLQVPPDLLATWSRTVVP